MIDTLTAQQQADLVRILKEISQDAEDNPISEINGTYPIDADLIYNLDAMFGWDVAALNPPRAQTFREQIESLKFDVANSEKRNIELEQRVAEPEKAAQAVLKELDIIRAHEPRVALILIRTRIYVAPCSPAVDA